MRAKRISEIINQKILKSAVQFTQSSFGCIFIYDEVGHQLICKSAQNCYKMQKIPDSNCRIPLSQENYLPSLVFHSKVGKIIQPTLPQEEIILFCPDSNHHYDSQIAVPIIKDDQDVLGVLLVASENENRYSELDLKLLSSLIHVGMSAFENSYALGHAEKMIARLGLLSDAANVLMSESEHLSLEQKFDFLVEKATSILDAELCTLWLAKVDHIFIQTSYRFNFGFEAPEKLYRKKILPITCQPGSGLHGYIAAQKQVLNLYGDELLNHPALRTQDASDFLSTEVSYSSLNQPILSSDGALLGLLCAYNKLDENGKPIPDSGFSQEFDEVLINILAKKLRIAIENANTVKQLQEIVAHSKKTITELSALDKVQEAITKFLDINAIFDAVLDAVIDVLKFDYATISEVKKSTGLIGTSKGRNVPDEWLQLAWHDLSSPDIQAWIAKHKKEVILTGWDDRLDREIYDRFHHEQFVRIFLPILARGEVRGNLEAGYFKTHQSEISPEEVEVLRKLVALAGIGIEQANLVEDQTQLVRELQADIALRNQLEKQLDALNQASINILISRSEAEAVNYVFKSLESIGYTRGMVSLLSEDLKTLEGKYGLGSNWQKMVPHFKIALAVENDITRAIGEKRSILIQDCTSNSIHHSKIYQEYHIKSQYVIPLTVTDRVFGVLQIDLSDMPELAFGDENAFKRKMKLLEAFASQSATAIHNIRNTDIIHYLQTSLAETAHEFRSPLHNILTQIGGLRSYLEDKYKEEKEIEEYVKIISEEVYRAKRQMENTLLFSDESRTAIGYHFELASLQDIVERCAESYRLRALDKGIMISIRDNVKKLTRFKFDKQKIEQVIINLLDNAVKYSHYNRPIEFSGFDDGSRINLIIWDKGLGIPETDFENIFKGFARSKVKDRIRYIPGTGLGLKISREIVEAHGGKIKVKSTPFFNDPRRIEDYEGFDTIFTIILPKQPKEK